jgi:hypothetical protein
VTKCDETVFVVFPYQIKVGRCRVSESNDFHGMHKKEHCPSLVTFPIYRCSITTC